MVGKIMMRLLLVAVCSAWMQAVSAYDLKGRVACSGKGIAEVIVTDGYSFCVTDQQGNFVMQADSLAEFVYIVTPKGYVADYSEGIPQFYQKLQKDKKNYVFDLKPLKGDSSKFALLTMADPQLDVSRDVERMFHETLPDMRQVASEYSDRPVFGLVLGDITWDNYKNNFAFKDFARQSGIPFYPVIGNHDFDKYLQPDPHADFAHVYKEQFGPLYYAFQMGDAYCIVLNNIDYVGHKRYQTTLEIEPQMHWLELLLNCVLQQDQQVFVAMHAPLKPLPEYPLIPGGEKLKKMLVNKFHATILSGHFHINSHADIGGGIMEHNIGAACGTWWTSDICRDGTPNGYQVFTGEGSAIRRYYKSTGLPKEVQMKIYRPGVIADRPKAVVAKVWDFDPSWSVQWYEDGQFKGVMSQFYSFDPDYLATVDGRRVVADYAPVRTNHYFSAYPSEQAKVIRIDVVDSFGTVYSDTLHLK